MTKPRWRLADQFVLVLFIALALAIGRSFWKSNATTTYGVLAENHQLVFAVYLVLLTTATLAARFSTTPARQFWLGYALFGWVYLALGLHAGFGVSDIATADRLVTNSIMGVGLGMLCGLAAHMLFRRREDSRAASEA